MTSAPSGRPANVLGALMLATSDRMNEYVEQELGLSETAAAALSALDQFLDRPAVDQLAKVVGLTQSGGVRLVDRLERDGLVRRGSGTDRRSASVSLTSAGRRLARKVESARLQVLDDVLAPLRAEERDTLASLTGRMLAGMMREPGATRWICRLCDLSACGRPAGRCPIEQVARARYGTRTQA
ncbi:MAG TPA: MarR family transcriptional regulator [Acidimicrobiales bacterium]